MACWPSWHWSLGAVAGPCVRHRPRTLLLKAWAHLMRMKPPMTGRPTYSPAKLFLGRTTHPPTWRSISVKMLLSPTWHLILPWTLHRSQMSWVSMAAQRPRYQAFNVETRSVAATGTVSYGKVWEIQGAVSCRPLVHLATCARASATLRLPCARCSVGRSTASNSNERAPCVSGGGAGEQAVAAPTRTSSRPAWRFRWRRSPRLCRQAWSRQSRRGMQLPRTRPARARRWHRLSGG
jgi:hypothetical protein